MARECFIEGMHEEVHSDARYAPVFVIYRDVPRHRKSPGKEIRAGNGERQNMTSVESFARNSSGWRQGAKLQSRENLSTNTCQTMPSNLSSACGRINPRKRRECRWRQSAGALPGLAREAPHSTYVNFGANMACRFEKVNVTSTDAAL